MTNKLIIIGEISDQDRIDSFCTQLEEKGIVAEPAYPATDSLAQATVASAPIAAVWLSSNTMEDMYKLAMDRKAKGHTTINIFADPVELTKEQRAIVGRNYSFFSTLNPEIMVDDLVKLLPASLKSTGAIQRRREQPKVGQSNISTGADTPKAPSGNADLPTIDLIPQEESTVSEAPKVAAFAHNEPEVENIDFSSITQSPAITIEEAMEMNSAAPMSEEELKQRKRALWMPWIWMAAFWIMTMALCRTELRFLHSDESMFYVVSGTYIFFWIKALTSSWKAFKISKWNIFTLLIALLFVATIGITYTLELLKRLF